MSEGVRWLWIENCADEEADWDEYRALHVRYRRYCHHCGQVVHVLQPEGETAVPQHLVPNPNGRNMTICEATGTSRVLEAAP